MPTGTIFAITVAYVPIAVLRRQDGQRVEQSWLERQFGVNGAAARVLVGANANAHAHVPEQS